MSKGVVLSKIEIQPNDEFLVWKIDGDYIAFDAELFVSSGCAAVSVINSVIDDIYAQGQYTVYPKRRKREIASIDIYGVNRDRHFTLNWGMGGVPYHDREYDLSCGVGANGALDISVYNPRALMSAFGFGKNITAEMVEDKIRTPLAEYAKGKLSELLNKYTYYTINQGLDEMSKALYKKVDELCADMGILLNSFHVKGFHFSGGFDAQIAERINEKRRDAENFNRRYEQHMDLKAELREKELELQHAKEMSEMIKNMSMAYVKDAKES